MRPKEGSQVLLDLTKSAGFPLLLDVASCRLAGPDYASRQPDIRTLEAMRPVLLDAGADGPVELYYMYRGVGPAAPQAEARRLGLRYDVTVLRPGQVGDEYVKTFGHVHPAAPDGLPYPELYQVVAGEAWFVLQSPRRALVIAARAGDCVLVPPGFGHVTVNVGSEPLVLANWVDGGFASDYGPYRERRGAAVYVVREDGRPALRPNPRYDPAPVVERAAPTPPDLLGLEGPGEPVFTAVCRRPERFRYLCEPTRGQDLWRALASP